MLLSPIRILRGIRRRVLRQTSLLEAKIRYDAHDRPQFAYGLFQAAVQAKALGYPRISTLEFGVAGGNGLLALERIAAEIESHLGVIIEVYGFDTGTGQPPPEDYRDAPFIWKAGQFRMDFKALESRLARAKLIIGDVGEGIRRFVDEMGPAPIGFMSFDMDYYSSTMRAFRLLSESHDHFLPRAFCYFDDIVGDDTELHCAFIGELLAINDFNHEHSDMKLAPIHGLATKRAVQDHWHIKTYVLHRFDHPRYGEFINARGDWQLPLRRRRGG